MNKVYTPKPVDSPHRALQIEATEHRLDADRMRQQASLLLFDAGCSDRKAVELEARLGRLGLRSFYVWPLHKRRG